MTANSSIAEIFVITHWGRVTYLCVSNISIINSDNGLSLGRRHVIIWTNAIILLMQNLGTNVSEILSEIKKIHLEMFEKWRQFCLGINVLNIALYTRSILNAYTSISLRYSSTDVKNPPCKYAFRRIYVHIYHMHILWFAIFWLHLVYRNIGIHQIQKYIV